MSLARASIWALGVALTAGSPALAQPADTLEARLARLFDGADALPGLRLRALDLGETRVRIGLELPPSVRLDDLPPEVDNRFEHAVGMIDAERPAVQRFELMVAHPGKPLAPPPRRPRLPPEDRAPRRNFVLPDPARFPDGQALAGRVVAISPGHGYIFYDTLNNYSTQRSRVSWNNCGGCRGIVEDFETYEIVRDQLIPLLEGAGAQVVLVRERDVTGTGVIVNDGAAGYREVSGAFTAGPTTNAQGGTSRRSSAADAVAEWTITPPAAGPQLVSMWFVSEPTLSSRARIELLGPFGTHVLTLDQQTRGRRWTPLGVLDLDPGTPLVVRLSSNGQTAPLTFDALRVGSGRHSPTNHPWWMMGADVFTENEGAPSSVTSLGDVTTRPAYAEFLDADLYVALHSNASGQPNSTAVGTSSYRYSCGTIADHATAPPAAQCDDPVGSARLQELIHARLIEQLRADWDPNWRDRGPRVADFGEVRGLVDMPGVLIESAFHDNVVLAAGSNLRMTENQALHDPRWRRAAALGMYRGISEFLVGQGPIVLAPPAALVARRVDATRVELRFGAIPGATRYRVYVAQGSRTFDLGRLTDMTTVVIDGLTPEVPAAFKVATLNAAGEGLSSKVVVARPSSGRAQLLVVDAFEREDAWVQSVDNKGDTAHVQARALSGVTHAFDGATEAAWADGLVTLAGYEGLVLALGRESTEHGVLTAPLRDQVAAFTGAVLASGSEIGWALDSRGDAASQAFLEAVFGARLASDSAAGTSLTVAPGGWLAGGMAGALALDDGSAGGLQAASSDAFTPTMGSITELTYTGGAQVAAVRKGNNLLLGVALDSIVGEGARAAIVGAWAQQAVTPVVIVPTDGGVVVVDGGVVEADGGVVVQPDAAAPGEDAAVVVSDGAVVVQPDAAAPGEDGGAVEPVGDAGVVDPADDRVVATSDDPIRGGCGCDASDSDAPSSMLLAAALLGLVAARSRRRAA